MMKRIMILGVLCASLLTPAFSQTARRVYDQAKAAQAAGNKDMALLFYRQILRQYPDSEFAEEACFYLGTYYLETRNYFQATQTLEAFLQKYPRSRYADTVKEYLGRINMGSLKERADRLFEESKLSAASVLYKQYLEVDPDNAEVKERLELIRKSQEDVKFGFEQLALERKKLEHEKEALNRQLAELEVNRKTAESLHKQALELNKVTVDNYEKKLAAASSQLEELNTRLAQSEKEAKEWQQRAVLAEAAKLSQPLGGRLQPLPEPVELPRIVFEGEKADPSPGEGEVQIAGIVRDGFPSVVITAEMLGPQKDQRQVEAVVSLDLTSPWPEGAKMKFRVDFMGKRGQPKPDPGLLVRYFDVSDMDGMEESINSYRKRLVFTAQDSLMERYEVSAFLVRTQ